MKQDGEKKSEGSEPEAQRSPDPAERRRQDGEERAKRSALLSRALSEAREEAKKNEKDEGAPRPAGSSDGR